MDFECPLVNKALSSESAVGAKEVFSETLAGDLARNADPETVSTANETVSEEVLPSAPNQLCEVMKNAAEDSGIPVGFFARLLWQESRFRSEEVSSGWCARNRAVHAEDRG